MPVACVYVFCVSLFASEFVHVYIYCFVSTPFFYLNLSAVITQTNGSRIVAHKTPDLQNTKFRDRNFSFNSRASRALRLKKPRLTCNIASSKLFWGQSSRFIPHPFDTIPDFCERQVFSFNTLPAIRVVFMFLNCIASPLPNRRLNSSLRPPLLLRLFLLLHFTRNVFNLYPLISPTNPITPVGHRWAFISPLWLGARPDPGGASLPHLLRGAHREWR